MCINGKFGPVCDNKWDNNEASLVCSQLGYSTDGEFARKNKK